MLVADGGCRGRRDDAALGRVTLADEAPSVSVESEEARIRAAIHGDSGSIRQGIVRHLVVRFELANGLHIYGEPVPDGLVATTVTLEGPPGLVTLDPVLPPPRKLHLERMGIDLEEWSGTVDIIVPFYPVGELVSEVRPLDANSVTVEVTVRYQACNDDTCLLP